eukprot:Sspe_Gene.71762::Locus_42639_Transcript_1_1_Confidence_1.000_Length_16151::g.71762::m.71762
MSELEVIGHSGVSHIATLTSSLTPEQRARIASDGFFAGETRPFSRVGCYYTGLEQRITELSGRATPALCYAECVGKAFTHFAILGSNEECTCGNSPPSQSRAAPSSACGRLCGLGNMCGGQRGTQIVYQIDSLVPSQGDATPVGSCKCDDGWSGEKCDQEKCERDASGRVCSGHGQCAQGVCTCATGYGGEKCDRCEERYAYYPACQQCSISTHCSGHATSVTPVDNKCKCSCRNSWTGEKCDTCNAPYGGSDCDACRRGYIGYSKCTRCTTKDHCNGHAFSVTSDGSGDRCICSCSEGFTGATCNKCASEYVMYPVCRKCSLTRDCNGHGKSVVPNSDHTGCVCDCTFPWQGASCNVCPSKYTGANCDQCGVDEAGVKRINYPKCTKCTSESHCNGRAVSVSSDGRKCTCQCKNKFTGNECETCPIKFGGRDCDQCGAGRKGFSKCANPASPECCERCTALKHCSGHATAVTASTCRDDESGQLGNLGLTCHKLVAKGGCEMPTSSVHQSLPRTTVGELCKFSCRRCPKGPPETCACTCRNSWSGPNCDKCHAMYAGDDCDMCAEGRVGYPLCRPCSIHRDCGGHATSVTSDGKKCICTCRNQWSAFARPCVPGVASVKISDVDGDYLHISEIEAFDGNGVNAAREGTVHASSTGRVGQAPSVVIDGDLRENHWWHSAVQGKDQYIKVTLASSQCIGAVRVQARGQPSHDSTLERQKGIKIELYDETGVLITTGKLDLHEAPFQGTFHTTHAEASCVDDPTGVVARSGSSCSALVNQAGCDTDLSTMNPKLERGTYVKNLCPAKCGNCVGTCLVCERRFDAKKDCAACAPGFGGAYPVCERCTIEDHCSGHAHSVKGQGNTCVCSCKNQWKGDKCSVCPRKYSGPECDQCASGRLGYPSCIECTNNRHCHGRALKIAAWYMQHPTCPWVVHTGEDNILQCADRSYCDFTIHGHGCCNNHGGTMRCPANHPRLCRDGTCVPESWDCSNHKGVAECSSSTSPAPGPTKSCECVGCRNGWTGPSCETCPPKFAGKDCDECAANRINYPDCVMCDVRRHCNNLATKAEANNEGTGCVCACKAGYTGASCNLCAEGHIAWPYCQRCTSAKHCSGRAARVFTDDQKSMCQCDCRNHWTGTRCQYCPTKFDYQNDCKGCATGFINYPTCVQCSVQSHCNGRASYVTSSPDHTKCECSCYGQWEGDTCDVCPPRFAGSGCNRCASGHVNYPTCTECKVEEHCSGHAVKVTSNPCSKSCVCTCRNRWYGTRCEKCDPRYTGDCDQCADGYVDYPRCYKCTNSYHCSGNAVEVTSDAERKRCQCKCRDGWTGDYCESCPSMFDQKTCSSCRQGLVGVFPDCYDCQKDDRCNGRSKKVLRFYGRSERTCDAKATVTLTADLGTTSVKQFIVRCTERCKEEVKNGRPCNYISYYLHRAASCKIQAECGLLVSSGSSTGVHYVLASSTASPAPDNKRCNCNCEDRFSGPQCEKCSAGHHSYPDCTQCTTEKHCSGHAVSVSVNDAQNGCECVCKNKWTGPQCEVCPPEFAGPECNRCSSGRIGYPDCSEVCSVDTHCSGHAMSVTSNADGTDCICTCSGQWNGEDCSVCSPEFSQTDCASCAEGYVGYPNCEKCHVDTHCSGNAEKAEVKNGVCTCTCRNQWKGVSCGVCSDIHAGDDCNRCAGGRIQYPECRACSIESDCFNRATSVDSDPAQTKCICTCFGQYTGESCETCPPRYDATEGCKQCATGFTGYPACGKCTVDDHCSGHAVSVTSDMAHRVCKCTCRNQWTGSKCEKCPSIFDGKDCDECAKGHINYPACTQCKVETSCSGNAVSVTTNPDKTSCQCACKGQFTGNDCSVCPDRYTGTGCSSCANNYIKYPECERCSVQQHCSGNAVTVWSRDGRVCQCKCKPGYAGPKCNKCAIGYVGYPKCRQCSQSDCSGNARAVTSDRSKCKCTCKNHWMGEACNECPTKYNNGRCDDCAPDHYNYPHCMKCTVDEHCSGHAQSVTSDGKACKCTCRNFWVGDDCSECPVGFAGKDCDTCADGYVGCPDKPRKCTVKDDCNENADSVTSDANHEKCICTCRNKWTGTSCSRCPSQYSEKDDCGECAPGHVTYDDCRKCSVRDDCTNHATSVTDNGDRTGCACKCRHMWSPPDCAMCPDRYDAGADCNKCAPGYYGYPACNQCTVEKHCSGRAFDVDSDSQREKCECKCRNQWTGSDCSVCPAKYSPSDDCGACASGHINFPDCVQCTAGAHCSNRGTVRGANEDRTQCNCNCFDQWTGLDCSECPAKYDSSTGCKRCAPGRINYPECVQCTVDSHCASHAVKVTADNSQKKCLCTCSNSWAPPDCQECPPQFDGQDCDRCAVGYAGYPVCGKCSISQHCSGRATSVTSSADLSSCVCTCRNKWSGDKCERCDQMYGGDDCNECADGYIGWPNCIPCATETHCNSRATRVYVEDGKCKCECRNGWFGDDCAQCPPKYHHNPSKGGCQAGSSASICGSGSGNTCPSYKHEDTCTGHEVEVSPLEGWVGMQYWSVHIDGDSKLPRADLDVFRYQIEALEKAKYAGYATTSTGLDNAGQACWDACGNSGGQCSFCGTGSCCRKNYNDPGCDGSRGCDTFHCCVDPSASTPVPSGLKNAGLECMEECGQGGPCGWCGTGSCCRKGRGDCGSHLTSKGCNGFHCCIDPNAGDVVVSTSVPGYCHLQNAPLGDLICNQHLCPDGTQKNIGKHFRIGFFGKGYFEFRAGADYGRGHVVFVNGKEIHRNPNDVWYGWNRYIWNFTTETIGPHVFDMYTSEGCCEYGTAMGPCTRGFQIRRPGAEGFETMSEDTLRGTVSCAPCEWLGDQGSDCDSCSGDRIDYPLCVQCTSETHCSGHASSVKANDDKTACECTCENMWEGPTCGTCPTQYGGEKCDRCAAGRINYPTCTRCSAQHCNRHAVNIYPNPEATACVCECEEGWKGETCGECAPEYISQDNTCTKCTPAQHCNDHAVSVTPSSDRESCECTCRSQWTGPTCGECPDNWSGPDCDECADGHIGADCVKCTIADHCHGKASDVESSADHTRCQCTCNEGYAGQSCGECKEGYVGFPKCTKCTVESHCNSRAQGVRSSPSRDRCICDCVNQWSGTNCETCPHPFAGANCDQCADKHINYADGCVECTVEDHCSSHATSVASNDKKTDCTCTCRNNWSGDDCSECPPQFGGIDCDKCAAGFFGDGKSCERCTQEHCSNHALDVTSTADRKTCKCTCRDQWEGDDCSKCPEKYEQSDCSRCAAGNVDYPTCRSCTVAKDCSGNADTVTSDGEVCVCSCAGQWTGEDCSTCPSQFDQGKCDRCASGHQEYPVCEKCTIADHCNGRAVRVTSDMNKCNCECSAQWSGDKCQTCDSKYVQRTCDACAYGRINYPTCEECTLDKHCTGSNNAVRVFAGDCGLDYHYWQGCDATWTTEGNLYTTCPMEVTVHGTNEVIFCSGGECWLQQPRPECYAVHATQCNCVCRHQFTGSDCSTCPEKYDQKTCASCAEGRVRYPECIKCTVDMHCNSKANSVSASGEQCKCSCREGYRGTSCGVCDIGFVRVGTDCVKCTVEKHCSSHATSVTSSWDHKTCQCTCKGQWHGDQCESCDSKYNASCDGCAANHINYPTCTECNVNDHCNGNANSVTAEGDKCKCACIGQFKGDSCETCPAKYTGVRCDQCAKDRINYPTCTKCTNDGHCNGNAASVWAYDETTCACSCKFPYTGSTCDMCPPNYDCSGTGPIGCSEGAVGYPKCHVCESDKDCNGRAASVTSDSQHQECLCTCRNKWEGDRCETCPTGFAGGDCDTCDDGYIGYPNCVRCTSTKHCNGHAISSTSSASRDRCMCNCEASYTGPECDRCALNHIGYPACTMCTVSTHCSGNALSVKSDEKQQACECTCRNQWSGKSCSVCPPNMNADEDCGSCAEGYIGYPRCIACEVDKHCNGNAMSVTSDLEHKHCVCACRNQWKGERCDECGLEYTDDCGKCASGFVKYPTCVKCTVGGDCSSHATAVLSDSTRTKCMCKCRNKWEGADCSQCDAIFDKTRDCGECAEGRINYPACTLCTSTEHCSSHADAVTSSSDLKSCVCMCRNQWKGKDCSECDEKFDATQDCGACSDGAINYPKCKECSVDDHCSGHADKVESNDANTKCECTCSNKWEGERCNSCPPQFGGEDCNQCAMGFIDYDKGCVKCEVSTHCNNNAADVTSDDKHSACKCTCLNKWEGESCGECPSRFNMAKNCGACAANHINYPECTECTTEKNCNNHASVVTSSETQCMCTCLRGYVGATCNECAEGFVGYPNCRECTNEKDCSSHAEKVTSDGETCSCACQNHWTGADCSQCPEQFDETANCKVCGPGRISYPECIKCSTDHHCSSHASSVAADSTQTKCVCTCSNHWQGETCSTCPAEYGGENCDTCAPNFYFVGHSCVPCSVDTHCSGHADSVASTADRKRCRCACRHKWEGENCDQCPVQYDKAQDCGECAEGHVHYPSCDRCTSKKHCNGNAVSVVSNEGHDMCLCKECRNQWRGDSCGVCPSKYSQGSDCNECAANHINYPECEQCSIVEHCSGNARLVRDEDRRKCVCTCLNKWEGEDCSVCPTQFSGPDCDRCATGHINYPHCTPCTKADHCSSHATAVTSTDGVKCECTCRNMWYSKDCSRCPAGYDKELDCAACSIGFAKAGTRCQQCTTQQHCTGHAVSVTSNREKCLCSCRNQWKGDMCETCPPNFGGDDCNRCARGYAGYPVCGKCTVEDHCSNHASSVTSSANGMKCECTCRNQWKGADCSTCDTNYAGGDCDECQVGHINYPACKRCDVAVHCNGHADAVASSADKKACLCDCRNAWSGPGCQTCERGFGGKDCDVCAEGFINYPTCRECSIDRDCNRNAVKVTSNTDRTACKCTCSNQWSGESCSTCPTQFAGKNCDECADGHIGYPQCTLCTVQNDCSGHAGSVTTDTKHTECICDCTNGWVGEKCNRCSGTDVVQGRRSSTCEETTGKKYVAGGDCRVLQQQQQLTRLTCLELAHDVGADVFTVDASGLCTVLAGECSMQADLENAISGCISSTACECKASQGEERCTTCNVETHCNDHATEASPSSDQKTCRCVCRNKWSGATCEKCPEAFAGDDCDACGVNRVKYPSCRLCTVDDDCSGRAESVAADPNHESCQCTCKAGYTGGKCELCALGYIRDRNGGCRKCEESDCSNHGSVDLQETTQTSCGCSCRNMWKGKDCSSCDRKYDQTDCNACGPGRIDYPSCELCSTRTHCDSHASEVVPDADKKLCVCTCRGQWSGETCSVCPSNFDSSANGDCSQCAEGYINYPTCTRCDVDTHCSGHADITSSNRGHTQCDCRCRNMWSGSDCSTCPDGY